MECVIQRNHRCAVGSRYRTAPASALSPFALNMNLNVVLQMLRFLKVQKG